MDMGALGGFWVFRGGLRCGSGDGATCRGGLCGIGPALAGKLGGESAFALRAGFFCGSLPMLAPDRSRCRLLGSAYEPDAEAAWPEAFPGSAS